MKVADGGKDRPTLILNPSLDDIVRRIFDMAVNGKSVLDISLVDNTEGIPTTTGNALVEDDRAPFAYQRGLHRHAGLGSERQGQYQAGPRPERIPCHRDAGRVSVCAAVLKSRAPKRVNPRRVASPYVLSGLVSCELCDVNMSAAESKVSKYNYYVC